jgi:hypothetical protein
VIEENEDFQDPKDLLEHKDPRVIRVFKDHLDLLEVRQFPAICPFKV